jgi:hypothetical protein
MGRMFLMILQAVTVASVLVPTVICNGAGLVIGTFDTTRSSTANVASGPYAEEARAAIATNFPGSSFLTSPTLTPQFLSQINILLITADKTDTVGITPLSASEQTAMVNYVIAGGSAFLLADGYFLTSAQSLVSPFGVTLVDDGKSGYQSVTPTTHLHPVINGPFGDTTQITMYGAGLFTNLGPHAVSLATMDSTHQPVLATIESHALGSSSGRVILMADSTTFADSGDGGFFTEHKTLFLNSMQYLAVPEPSGWVLAVFAGLTFAGTALARKRQAASD